MNRFRLGRFRLDRLVLLLCLSTVAGPAFAASDVHVVASVKPVHSVLSGLMEGLDPPELLIEGDQLPYAFSPDAGQLATLEQADLIVWAGPELEKQLAQPLAGLARDKTVLTLLDSPDLKLLDSRWDPAVRDPYFWLDSRNGLILIDELTHALISIDPGRSHLYRRNRDKVYARMKRLDRELEYGYRGLAKGVALSYYDTQQYFEQAYALKIGESLSPSPDAEMAAADLLAARNRLLNGEFACLLLEAEMPMPNLELLTGGAEAEIGYLDSLGLAIEPGPDLYFELMAQNTTAIKQCFKRSAADSHALLESDEPVAPEEMGGRFMLVDQDGVLFTDSDLLGKYQLIFFGYTSCPDVCPTSMVVVSQALRNIGEAAEKVQAYFVSVDPERDTPEVLKRYVGYFDDRIVALTGAKTMIDRLARSYNVRYEKVVDDERDSDFYVMDHTASIFLMSPDGRFVTKFPFGTTSVDLAAKLKEYLR